MSAICVAQALADARARGLARLDAQLLMAAVLHRQRSWLLAHDEYVPDVNQLTQFGVLSARRAEGEPVAYLLGEKEFYGLRLKVNPAVLIPRPETEIMVEWALELLCRLPTQATILDLGTGSGAVALALAQSCPLARVCGVDICANALAVACANGERLGLKVEWLQSDWWTALAGRRFDLVVSNPPYVALWDDHHLKALRHEPQLALTAGNDGLAALRFLVGSAADYLAAGGWLLLEHGHDQAAEVQALLSQHGFVEASVRQDLSGQFRCSGGRTILIKEASAYKQ